MLIRNQQCATSEMQYGQREPLPMDRVVPCRLEGNAQRSTHTREKNAQFQVQYQQANSQHAKVEIEIRLAATCNLRLGTCNTLGQRSRMLSVALAATTAYNTIYCILYILLLWLHNKYGASEHDELAPERPATQAKGEQKEGGGVGGGKVRGQVRKS